MIPTKIFFTKGVGRDKDKLDSFELALRDAGIEKYNLVHVSSILAPGCKIVPKEEGLKYLQPGQIVFVVDSLLATNEPSRLLAASVGCAVPADSTKYGYLSEHFAYGETDEKAGDYAEDLAAQMLARTLGLDLKENLSWDEREKQYKLSGQIIKTFNFTQSALGDKTGLWTTVVAAGVFCDYRYEQPIPAPAANGGGLVDKLNAPPLEIKKL